MKQCILSALFFLTILPVFCQPWTAAQLTEANTAANVEYLSSQEKQVIQYINLCRLYPKQFAINEVKNYKGIPFVKDKALAKFKASLMKDLNSRPACEVLEFDEDLYDDADCYAAEISTNKRLPHQRIDCEKSNYAECIFFGSAPGKAIALEWLIDSGVANLGHRKNCLNSKYAVTGLKITVHYQYRHCAVAEFAE